MQIPLETLRSKLLEYAEEMRGKLVELVNEDYDEFAALSTKLVNVDAAISELEEPILAAKSEIESVRHGLMSHSTALKETLQRRHDVAELKASLELANAAAQSLSNVQKLVHALEEDTITAKARTGVLSHEALCKSLDRICSEMGRLLYLLQDSNHMQIIRNMEGQVASIKSAVENKLENALVQVLKEQDPTSLATLLHAYSTIGSTTTAERIIKDCVIAPCCASSLDAQNSNTPSDSLKLIQQSLRQEVWQFLEVAISTCSSSLPYDFPGQAVFPEVMRAVESRHPTMYSPGNPRDFQHTYRSMEAFIGDLESLCLTASQVTRFRCSQSFQSNKARWNFAAYFSLCFQDIASTYESKLPSFKDAFNSCEKENSVWSTCIEDCIASMEECLSDATFILPVADKLVRLQLQIVSRFAKWVEGLIEYASAEEHALPVPAPKCMAQLCGSIHATPIAAIITRQVRAKLGNSKAADLVEEAFEESETNLRRCADGLLDVSSTHVAATCAECLGQIRGIVAAFRMTARVPTAAAQYSTMILKPLEQFKLEIVEASENNTEKFCMQVIDKVSARFSEVAKETLETAHKTEESLKKLKSRKNLPTTAEDSTSLSTDQLVEMQLALDIKEFVQRACSLLMISPQRPEEMFAKVPEVKRLYDITQQARNDIVQ